MKRYHFPLRPVGVLRAHQEVRAREVFAASVHKVTNAEKNLGDIRADKTRLEAALIERTKGKVHASETSVFYQAYRQKCASEVSAERALNAAKAEMNTNRKKYSEANREVKIIDRLEEKSRAQYRLESERAAQAELDDFAGHRFIRERTKSEK